jgi:hypothetical protein
MRGVTKEGGFAFTERTNTRWNVAENVVEAASMSRGRYKLKV